MDRVQQHIAQLGKEIKLLIRSAIEISYFSRGSIQYEAVLNMTAGEREVALDFINHRLEIAAKMPYPVF